MFTAHNHHLVEDSINEPESRISLAAANEVYHKKKKTTHHIADKMPSCASVIAVS